MTAIAPLPQNLESVVDALTARGEGAFSSAQARGAGISRDQLRRLTHRGVVVRLTHGWYARRDPSLTAQDRHRRTAAALCHRIENAVLSHQSALLAMDLSTFAVDLTVVHLTHRTDTTHRRRADCVLHPADASTRDLPHDARTVRCADAIVQAGRINPLTALVAADEALHRRFVTRANLDAALDRYAKQPATRPVAAILARADARSESVAETLARHALNVLGYSPTPQYVIHTEGHRYSVDLELDGLLIEVDGMLKYGPEAHNGASAQEAIRAEKDREAALVRAGYRPPLRLTWHQIVAADGRLRYDNLTHLIAGSRSAAHPQR